MDSRGSLFLIGKAIGWDLRESEGQDLVNLVHGCRIRRLPS
jgi:hypothetical protein